MRTSAAKDGAPGQVLTAQKIVIKHDHSGVIPIRINVMAEPDDSSSLIRSLLPYTSAAVIVATLYAGWTIWSRHQSIVDAVQAQKQQEAQRDQVVVHELGDAIDFRFFQLDQRRPDRCVWQPPDGHLRLFHAIVHIRRRRSIERVRRGKHEVVQTLGFMEIPGLHCLE